MRYLLDTNICIYIIKRSPARVYEKFKTLRVGDIGLSAITFCELQYGVSKSANMNKNQFALNEFLAPLEILDFPADASPAYGNLRVHLQKAGTPIGNYDLLIAAHALKRDLILVTNNTKEFCRVPHLKIENWIEPLKSNETDKPRR